MWAWGSNWFPCASVSAEDSQGCSQGCCSDGCCSWDAVARDVVARDDEIRDATSTGIPGSRIQLVSTVWQMTDFWEPWTRIKSEHPGCCLGCPCPCGGPRTSAYLNISLCKAATWLPCGGVRHFLSKALSSPCGVLLFTYSHWVFPDRVLLCVSDCPGTMQTWLASNTEIHLLLSPRC